MLVTGCESRNAIFIPINQSTEMTIHNKITEFILFVAYLSYSVLAIDIEITEIIFTTMCAINDKYKAADAQSLHA